MPELDAHDAARTHYCRHPGCTNEARSDRGVYSRCAEHQGRGPVAARRPNGGGAQGTLESGLRELQRLAREADRLRAKAAKLTSEALAAKQTADRAAIAYQDALRVALGTPLDTHGDD